jgi:predicted RNA-binding Zn-ribbon protein involved in translation (DUF1610 family)
VPNRAALSHRNCLKITTEAHLLTMNNAGKTDVRLLHVHVCVHCGSVFRREQLEGRPNTTGIYPCSKCGIDGPLNIEIREIDATGRELQADD